MTRAGVAWMAVGCARGAYEHALAYACERQQFGRPIGGFQLVQDLLVRMLGNITASACLCARLSQLQAAGLAADEHASLAKAFCTVRMRETVGWARELLGGNGILLEHHVGRFVADAEADLLLRGHPGDEHPDRRPRDHRPQRLRLNPVAGLPNSAHDAQRTNPQAPLAGRGGQADGLLDAGPCPCRRARPRRRPPAPADADGL